MKELIKYTADFDLFDSKNPHIETKYKILIEHDNTLESIHQKLNFKFVDINDEIIAEQKINEWVVLNIRMKDYYGRAMVCVMVADPKKTRLPEFESGGFSLHTDEEYNIGRVVEKLTILFKEVLINSFFANYRARLDYIKLLKK